MIQISELFTRIPNLALTRKPWKKPRVFSRPLQSREATFIQKAANRSTLIAKMSANLSVCCKSYCYIGSSGLMGRHQPGVSSLLKPFRNFPGALAWELFLASIHCLFLFYIFTTAASGNRKIRQSLVEVVTSNRLMTRPRSD